MPSRIRTIGVVTLLGMLAFGAQSCSTTATPQETGSTAVQTYGDVTLTKCSQDPVDHTSIDAAGAITSHYQVPYDYSFAIDAFDGTTPAGQSDVSEASVQPGTVHPWSAQFSIPGFTSGSFTCRLRNIVRMASAPS